MIGMAAQNHRHDNKLERETGFEPATSDLDDQTLPTELLPLLYGSRGGI